MSSADRPSLRAVYESFVHDELGSRAVVAGYRVRRVPGSSYLIGNDDQGRVALLVEASDSVLPVTPTRLRSFEAHFRVNCEISIDGEVTRTTLAVLRCLDIDVTVSRFFLAVCDSLVDVIGPRPSQAELSNGVDQLASIFVRADGPSTASITGILGELVVVLGCPDTDYAISSWRRSQMDRYDFVGDFARIEAKATTGRDRRHSISFEQANPAGVEFAIFSSCFIEYLDAGSSAQDLVDRVANSCATADSVLKLHSTLALTLGTEARRLESVRFDLALAMSSLAFYDAFSVPALRETMPTGVSGVRFSSNFDLAPVLDSQTVYAAFLGQDH